MPSEPEQRLDQHVERHGPPTDDPADALVQMNVRVKRSMITALDTRRKALGMTRDDWIRNVIEWALYQAPGTPVRSTPAAVNGRRPRTRKGRDEQRHDIV
jgi:hypothetical protein